MVSSRKLGSGESWIDTGLKRVISFAVVERDGWPFRVDSSDTKKILASSGDTIAEYKDVVSDCESEPGSEKAYICSLTTGKIINGASAENCYIHTGETATLAIDGVCCE